MVFDPAKVSFADLLKVFWESHDPTQGMRQGNDMGTQYRSGIYTYSAAQAEAAQASRDEYNERLSAAGYNAIQPKSSMRPSFTTLRSITSNTLIRTPRDIAVLAEQALPAVLEPASALKRVRVRALRTRRYQH